MTSRESSSEWQTFLLCARDRFFCGANGRLRRAVRGVYAAAQEVAVNRHPATRAHFRACFRGCRMKSLHSVRRKRAKLMAEVGVQWVENGCRGKHCSKRSHSGGAV